MSEQQDDFISFEKALRDLKMQSEELKKLVSEGEIRAFRDGESMKFRREDIDAMHGGGDQLVFADSLEDDTGMVTAELSEEDTLLADDDLLEEDERATATPAAPSARRSPTAARVRAAAEEGPQSEPGWVTAVSVLCSVCLIYGLMVVYKIATETAPSGLTAWFAK